MNCGTLKHGMLFTTQKNDLLSPKCFDNTAYIFHCCSEGPPIYGVTEGAVLGGSKLVKACLCRVSSLWHKELSIVTINLHRGLGFPSNDGTWNRVSFRKLPPKEHASVMADSRWLSWLSSDNITAPLQEGSDNKQRAPKAFGKQVY
jgi:hypothetical protein